MSKQDIESLWFEEHGDLMFLNSIIKDTCGHSIPREEFYSKLLSELNRTLPVESAFIMSRSGPKSDIQINSTFPAGKPTALKLEAEKYIARWAYQIKECIILNNKIIDIKIMDPYSSDLEPSTNCYLFSPVIHKGDVLGVLVLINKKKGTFNLRDKFLAEAACGVAALFETTNAEKTALALSEHERGMIHDLTSGFIAINDEGIISLINARAQEILELDDSAIGKFFYEVLPLNRSFFTRITEGLKSHKTEQRSVFTLDIESKKKIGYSTFIINGPKNKPNGLGIIFQDLSKLK